MIETALLMAVFLVVVSQPTLRSVFRAAPARYQAIAGTIAAATLAGQLAGDGRATYPFVDWAMYTKLVSDHPTYFKLSMVRGAGRAERVPIETLFRGASVGLRIRVRGDARSFDEAPQGDERRLAAERLTELLSAISARYNREHPKDPIRALRIERCEIPMEPDGSAGAAACRLVWEVESESR